MRPTKLVIFFLAAYLWSNYWWLDDYFGPVQADQLIFHLQAPIQATSNSFFPSYLLRCLAIPALLTALYGLILFKKAWFERKGRLRLRRLLSAWAGPVLLLAGAAVYGLISLQPLEPVLQALGLKSTDYSRPPELERRLAQARPVKNLVLIFMESLEASYSRPEIFGRNLLAELEAAGEFSFENYQQANGARWTLAALAANLCARPTTVFSGGRQGRFWPETDCLPDILAAHGYRLRYLQGGDSRFAGTDWFLRDHGLAPARDLIYYQQQGRPDLGGKIGAPDWGFKDQTLYSLAREELIDLSREPEPFALIMMTIDTHGVDGFLDESCPREFGDFRDVVRCASLMGADFVNWIKSQDFGRETVIVVVADHQVMANGLSKKYLEPLGRRRPLFNTIIGAEFETPPEAGRPISHLDMLPLVLEALQ